MGSRKLLREGPLTKYKSGRKIRAFLCNDVLVLTDDAAKSLYRMVRSTIRELGLDIDHSHSPSLSRK